MKINEKHTLCEGVKAFFGVFKCVYTRAKAGNTFISHEQEPEHAPSADYFFLLVELVKIVGNFFRQLNDFSAPMRKRKNTCFVWV